MLNNKKIYSDYSFFKNFCIAFRRNKLAYIAFLVLITIFLFGIYAPFFASSKPFIVKWQGKYYFPFFRYLFFKGFYTKDVDLFFNIFMFIFPLIFVGIKFFKGKIRALVLYFLLFVQFLSFLIIRTGCIPDPTRNLSLKEMRLEEITNFQLGSSNKEAFLEFPKEIRSWLFEKRFMSNYEQLSLLLKEYQNKTHHNQLLKYQLSYTISSGLKSLPSRYQIDKDNYKITETRLKNYLNSIKPKYDLAVKEWYKEKQLLSPMTMALARAKLDWYLSSYKKSEDIEEKASLYQNLLEQMESSKTIFMQKRNVLEEYTKVAANLSFIQEKQKWIEKESENIKVILKPFFSLFHWEEDAVGSQALNKHVDWWHLTRINSKHLLSSLLFGIRVSFFVGFVGIFLALLIGIPIGLIAGYFGGIVDLLICRFIEIWETMPLFFMLLLIVSITQVKSLFLIIFVLGLFGWTSFSRYVRAEVFKQRSLPYVLSAKSVGFGNLKIMFSHILPNSLVSVTSMLPFALMAKISSEAGLSFLGLGEDNSTSLGALMYEAAVTFPAESYLLWPPALLLSILLASIAIIGDGIRDALDPRLRI